MSQRSFASAEFELKKRTRREKFLVDMERVVHGSRFVSVTEPMYPTSGRVGRHQMDVLKMLRVYLVQQWYRPANVAPEEAIYDSQGLRDFVVIDLSRESGPDATTLLKFRLLLVSNDLTKALLDTVRDGDVRRSTLTRCFGWRHAPSPSTMSPRMGYPNHPRTVRYRICVYRT